MPKKYLPYIVSILTALLSVAAWWSVKKTIADASAIAPITVPLVSLFGIILILSFAIAKNGWLFVMSAILSLATPLLFFGNVIVFIGGVTGLFLIVWAREAVQSDLGSSLKIRPLKSFTHAITPVMFGFSVLITAQYYAAVSVLPVSELVPTIRRNQFTNRIVSIVVSRIAPDIQASDAANVSVDDFLLTLYEEQQDRTIEKGELGEQSRDSFGLAVENYLGEEFTEEQKQSIDSLVHSLRNQISAQRESSSELSRIVFISEWKGQLSELAGYNISGMELIGDVFIAIVNEKIERSIAGGVVDSPRSNLLPIVSAAALFLVLISVGMLLVRVWVAAAAMLFWLCRRIGLIPVITIQKEAEEISLD